MAAYFYRFFYPKLKPTFNSQLNILTLLHTLPFIQLVRGVFKEVRSSNFGLLLNVTSTLKILPYIYILQPY